MTSEVLEEAAGSTKWRYLDVPGYEGIVEQRVAKSILRTVYMARDARYGACGQEWHMECTRAYGQEVRRNILETVQVASSDRWCTARNLQELCA